LPGPLFLPGGALDGSSVTLFAVRCEASTGLDLVKPRQFVALNEDKNYPGTGDLDIAFDAVAFSSRP
jgi:hypothetical protein